MFNVNSENSSLNTNVQNSGKEPEKKEVVQNKLTCTPVALHILF